LASSDATIALDMQSTAGRRRALRLRQAAATQDASETPRQADAADIQLDRSRISRSICTPRKVWRGRVPDVTTGS